MAEEIGKYGRIKYTKGQKINLVTFLEEVKSEKDRRAKFVCFCGNIFEAWIHSVKSNVTKSCGCYKRKYMRDKRITHGLSRHPLYNTYNNMMERCYTVTNNSYKDYGGDGVSVCEEWKISFDAFYKWAISNGWNKGLQLDKDIIGDGKLYSPNTCCFVTPKDNSNSRKSSRFINCNGQIKTMAQWASISGILNATLFARLKAGWDVNDAIFLPIQKLRRKCQK